MLQRVLKEQQTIVDGQILSTYTIENREFKTPCGSVVLNSEQLDTNVSNALDYIYSAELAENVKKASDRLEKLENSETATRDDVDRAKIALTKANARYKAYPTVTMDFDDFALLLAGIITGSKLVSIKKADAMIRALRNTNLDVSDAKKVVVEYVNSIVNLRECEYCKPYDASGLNLAKVANLRMLAIAETKKWTALGIESKTLAERKVWQQVMLTILEECFKLTVEKDEKKSGRTVLLEV